MIVGRSWMTSRMAGISSMIAGRNWMSGRSWIDDGGQEWDGRACDETAGHYPPVRLPATTQ